MNSGWVCQKCQKSNAPWKESCDCISSTINPVIVYPTNPYQPISVPTWPSPTTWPITICQSDIQVGVTS